MRTWGKDVIDFDAVGEILEPAAKEKNKCLNFQREKHKFWNEHKLVTKII